MTTLEVASIGSAQQSPAQEHLAATLPQANSSDTTSNDSNNIDDIAKKPNKARVPLNSEKVKELLNIGLQLFEDICDSSRRENVADDDWDDSLPEDILFEVLKSCHTRETDLLFAWFTMTMHSVQVDLSPDALKLIIKIVYNEKASVQLRVRCLQFLHSRRISSKLFGHCEHELLEMVRYLNSSEMWYLKYQAIRFYCSLVQDCARQMFHKRVDFLWPLFEECPQVMGEFMLQAALTYFCLVLSQNDEVLRSLHVTLRLDGLRTIAKRFDDLMGSDLWFKMVMNLLSFPFAKQIVTERNDWKKYIIQNNTRTYFAFVCYVMLVGGEQAIDDIPGGCLAEVQGLLQSIEQRLTAAADDYRSVYRIVSPLQCILSILKAKPLEKLHSFTEMFLKNSLIGQILFLATRSTDLQLILTSVEIIFCLGFRSQDRDSLHRCLVDTDPQIITHLETLKNSSLGEVEDRNRLQEVLSWKPNEAALIQSVIAFQQVTQCDTAICEKLLRTKGMDLPKAIQLFFEFKDKHPSDENAVFLYKLISHVEGESSQEQSKKPKLG